MSLQKLLCEVYDYEAIPQDFVQRLTADGNLDQNMMIQHQAHKLNVFFVKLWIRTFGVAPSKLTYMEWLAENDIKPFENTPIAVSSSLVENFINRLIILKLGLMTKINLLDFGKFANEVISKLSDAAFIHTALIEKLETRYNVKTQDHQNVVASYVSIMKQVKTNEQQHVVELQNPVTKFALGSAIHVPTIAMNTYHRDLWLLSKDVYFQAKLMDHHVVLLYDIPTQIDIVETVKYITQISSKYCIVIIADDLKQQLQFPESTWVCKVPRSTIGCIPRIAPWCLVVSDNGEGIGLALDKSSNLYIQTNEMCPNTHYYWKTQLQPGLSEFKKTQISMFDRFVYDYYCKHKDAITAKYFIPRNISSNKCIVLVDNRANELSVLSAQFALLNTTEEWRLLVLTSSNNIAYYKGKLPSYAEITTLSMLNHGVFDIDMYNEIMEDPATWQLLKDMGIHHALIIQDDGMLVRKGVDRFLEYDYVGAPWKDAEENIEIKERISSNLVGNGGLSLRSVDWMLEVTTKYPIKETFYHNLVRMPEDVYFVKYMTQMGAKIPTSLEASYFSVEQVMNTKSIGFHKFWLYNSPKDTKEFFNAIIS